MPKSREYPRSSPKRYTPDAHIWADRIKVLDAAGHFVTVPKTVESALAELGVAPPAHAGSHLATGADPITADGLRVVYAPTGYAPTDPTLAGHLAGLDAAAGGAPAFSVSASDYTMPATSQARAIYYSTGAVDRTLNLPPAASFRDRSFTVKKVDAGIGHVLVTPRGAEAIDGATGAGAVTIVAQYAAVTLASDGFNWWIL